LADPEFQMGIMPPLGTFGDPLEIRGVGPTGIKIRDEFRIESGRMFRSGVQELLIGVGAAQVLGLKIGDKVLMPGGFWPRVGTLSNGGCVLRRRAETAFRHETQRIRIGYRKAREPAVIR